MNTENLIIGAGPAGLAMAGRFRNVGLSYEIIEQSDSVGVTWQNHYDRLHLHTVKQLSSLPHLDFTDDYPTYIPRLSLVEYFKDYVEKFGIKPHFNQKVTSIDQKNKKWEIKTSSGKEITAGNVIIATGVNRGIKVPTWSGQEHYKGEIIHSKFYKNPKPYTDKKVLVVGMGNTGAEVVLDLSEHGVVSHISVRSEISIIPRDVFGQPVQLTAKKLAKIPFGIGDWVGSQIRKVVIGDLSKYGLKLSKMHPAEQLRKTGKTPVLDIGTAKAIQQGKIKVQQGIREFTADGIIFTNGVKEFYLLIKKITNW